MGGNRYQTICCPIRPPNLYTRGAPATLVALMLIPSKFDCVGNARAVDTTKRTLVLLAVCWAHYAMRSRQHHKRPGRPPCHDRREGGACISTHGVCHYCCATCLACGRASEVCGHLLSTIEWEFVPGPRASTLGGILNRGIAAARLRIEFGRPRIALDNCCPGASVRGGRAHAASFGSTCSPPEEGALSTEAAHMRQRCANMAAWPLRAGPGPTGRQIWSNHCRTILGNMYHVRNASAGKHGCAPSFVIIVCIVRMIVDGYASVTLWLKLPGWVPRSRPNMRVVWSADRLGTIVGALWPHNVWRIFQGKA